MDDGNSQAARARVGRVKSGQKKPPRNGMKTNKATLGARVKAAQAMTLRMEGRTFDAIAKELGYAGKQGAYDAVRRSLREVIREPAEELIRLDLERLDVLWGIQYLNAQSGDVQAMAACMKIMERRAKILGLDAVPKAPEADSLLDIFLKISERLPV